MHRQQAVSDERLALALHRQRRNCVHVGGVASQPQCLVPDQDLAGLGRLLQTSRDVHRVAGGESLLRTCDDLTGRHSDAPFDAEVGQRVAHRDSGA